MYMNLSLKQGIFNTHDAMNYKTSDSHSYLHYRSCHNPSTKNSIPFSQFLGCLCSDDANFAEKADEMTDFFNNRHNLIILMSLIKNVIYRACFSNIIGLPGHRNKRKPVLEITKMFHFYVQIIKLLNKK